MRLVTVKAPAGKGKQIADVAFAAGIAEVAFRQEIKYSPSQQEEPLDVVETQSPTPTAKKYIETLMEAPFYDPDMFTFSIRQPESQFGKEPPAKETYPIVRPTPDVYQELWQFTRVTISLIIRVFLAAVLLAYGMTKDIMPILIAGLLFLPYHHNLLGVSLGTVLKETKLLKNSLLALLLSTLLIFLAGVCVGLVTEPPVEYNELGTLLSGMILATVVGIGAGIGALDDSGRRELIGLAASAHITVFPAWFGLKFVYGFHSSDKLVEHLMTFGLNITCLMVAAGATFLLMGVRGEGIRRFVRQKLGKAQAPPATSI